MSKIANINEIVITPGHGGTDPGAVSNGRREADHVTKICKYIIDIHNMYQTEYKINPLKFTLIDDKNTLNLSGIIGSLNKLFPKSFDSSKKDNKLFLEVHQDMNAPHLIAERQNKQMGIYHFEGDVYSQSLADELTKKFISYGAYNGTPDNLGDFNGSWRRGHYLDWRGFHLGFIQNTKGLAMILECGYVSGRNSDEDLKRFAIWIYQALVEIKTGKTLQELIQTPQQKEQEIELKKIQLEKDMFYEIKHPFMNELQISEFGTPEKISRFNQIWDQRNGKELSHELINLWRNNEMLQKQLEERNNAYNQLQTNVNELQQQVQNQTALVTQDVVNDDINQIDSIKIPKLNHVTMNTKSFDSVVDTLTDSVTMPKVVSEYDKTFNRHINQTVTALIIALSTLIVKYMNQALGWDISVELFNAVINVNFIIDTLTNLIASLFFMISSNNAFSSFTDYLRKIKINEK